MMGAAVYKYNAAQLQCALPVHIAEQSSPKAKTKQMRYDSTPYGIGHGEGSPLLNESEDAAQHNLFTGYKYFTGALKYSHNEALQAIGITEEKLQTLLKRYAKEEEK